MSTLVVENINSSGVVTTTSISDGTSTIGITNTAKGSAKAWVHAAGNGFIYSSYNISSAVELSGNLLKITFTTPFANTSYLAVAGACKLFVGNDPYVLQEYAQPGDGRTAAYCTFYINQNGVRRESNYSVVFYSA